MKNSFVSKYRAEAALLVVTLIWGGTFATIKEALDSASPMVFISLRFTLATIITLPLLIKYRNKVNAQALKAGAFLGVLIFLGFATQTVGLKYTTATKSGFITGSAVVLIPILQIIIERKKPTAGVVAGVILVFTGILFLSSGGNSVFTLFEELGDNFNAGDFFTLLCALFFALYVVYLDMISKKHELMVLVFMQIAVSAVLGIIAALFFDTISVEVAELNFTPYLFFSLVYTALLATLVTTLMQTHFQKEVTPAKAGIIYSFEPVFAAVIAFFALNEKITNFGLLGCLLIFAGLFSAEVYDNIKKRNYE